MSEVYFYHLERQTLEEVLPTLLEKTLERGWRAIVEATDEDRCEHLDRHLWTYRDDSFLPHARPVDGATARQPIVLLTGPDNPNGATVRFLVDRAPPRDVGAYRRVVLLFSADDPVAVAEARTVWQSLKGAGHDCTYWRQTPEGQWERKG